VLYECVLLVLMIACMYFFFFFGVKCGLSNLCSFSINVNVKQAYDVVADCPMPCCV
jgi:hypothetical protein